MKNTMHAHADRGFDLYETPRVAVDALMRVEPLPKHIWEPACGRGAIAKPLREAGHNVVASDLVDHGWSGRHVEFDFLSQTQARADCIVTNPPFKHANEFVRLAVLRAPKVVMLLRLAFLESERRRDIIGPGLARVHAFRNRLPMMHRDGWTGPKATSSTAFAWFVWERDHTGPIEIHPVSWDR